MSNTFTVIFMYMICISMYLFCLYKSGPIINLGLRRSLLYNSISFLNGFYFLIIRVHNITKLPSDYDFFS